MSSALFDPDDALRRVLDAVAPLPSEEVALFATPGRILAQSIESPAALPAFDNASMDGYALAGGGEPVVAGTEWPIEGEQAAGEGVRRARSGAWEIMTGARLPDGLDRVVPVEQVTRLDASKRVRLTAAVAPWENVRKAGSDVAVGETVLAAGTLLAPQHLMLLAALGQARVRVIERPRVAVLSTGRELVDDPAQPLAPGQIRNGNGPFLAARFPRAGARVVHRETVGDEIEPFLAAFARARAAGAGIVVSTGAVSMGRYDFVPAALQRLGAKVLFHRLAIRPGKPLLCARLPDGALFFGLPGNPVSAAVGLRFFVEPALRAQLGLPPESPWRVSLAGALAHRPGLRWYMKSRIAIDEDGKLRATVLPGQASYRIKPLADANSWVVVPIAAGAMADGTLVDLHGLGHLESPVVGRSDS